MIDLNLNVPQGYRTPRERSQARPGVRRAGARRRGRPRHPRISPVQGVEARQRRRRAEKLPGENALQGARPESGPVGDRGICKPDGVVQPKEVWAMAGQRQDQSQWTLRGGTPAQPHADTCLVPRALSPHGPGQAPGIPDRHQRRRPHARGSPVSGICPLGRRPRGRGKR